MAAAETSCEQAADTLLTKIFHTLFVGSCSENSVQHAVIQCCLGCYASGRFTFKNKFKTW